MPECTEAERKMIDRLRECDVVFGLRDKDMTTIAWMAGFDERPPANFTVDYGRIDGERIIRRLKLTMGLTEKQFNAAVERGKATDAAVAS